MKTALFDTGTSRYLEKPRAEYRGQPRVSPITGLVEPYYPTWRRRLKIYLVSYPLLLLSLVFAIIAMTIYLGEFISWMGGIVKFGSLWRGVHELLCTSMSYFCMSVTCHSLSRAKSLMGTLDYHFGYYY